MLLEFRVKNYKVFREEMVFSMKKAPKQSDLKYSILKKKQGRRNVEGLCSSVIYGPNASGKTNLISAMDTFKAIISRGNILNADSPSSLNPASSDLNLIPNNQLDSSEPIEFFIEFLHEKMLFSYRLRFEIGGFAESKQKRKVILEELHINQTLLFTRSQQLNWGDMKEISKFADKNKKNLVFNTEMAHETLNESELFLTNGFKLLFSQKMMELVISWFREKFVIYCSSERVRFIPSPHPNAKKGEKYYYDDQLITKAASEFGLHTNSIAFVQNDEGVSLCSTFIDIKGNYICIDSETFESLGTIRFLNLFPLIYNALAEGNTLVLDEFDASIHPMAIMSLINVFHNDEINVNGAQLIFNTHNPIFLNKNLFRRDEIKFVERDPETHESTLYALSDFGTAGATGVRKGDDYMKNYFVNQYGAIENIDFSSLFEDLLLENNDDSEGVE